MLDSLLKPYTEKPLARAASALVEKRFTSGQILMGALFAAFLAAFTAGMQAYVFAFLLLLVFRLLLEIEPAMARVRERSLLETLLCGAVPPAGFAIIVLLFGMGTNQGMGAAFMLFCYLILTLTSASLLYLEDRITVSDNPGPIASILSRLVGRTETHIYFLLIFIYSDAFSAVSMIFGLLCLAAACGQVITAFKSARDGEETVDSPEHA